ncbi:MULTISPECIES: DUF1592 domain-containing protein [Sorangium]|uniref:DUF1592 domain-containing protein n=1 Tax=Sorangium TaxID=39643 RepID=UPI001F2D3CCC|nr:MULTISPECIES: DUF1592 domain-containing protein [Sorangium]
MGNLGDVDGTPSDSSGGNGGDSSNPDGTPPIGDPPPQPHDIPKVSECLAADKGTPGPRVVRRLAVDQFEATVRDLFRDPSITVPPILDDKEVLGFRVDANALVIRDGTAKSIMLWAEETADWAVTSKLDSLTSATCRTVDEACRGQFIRDFGRRAFRQKLTDEQFKSYDTLFGAEKTFEDGAKVVVAAMLQSPYFLYRREIGNDTGAGVYELGPYEVANNLSYLITGTMPDDALLQAADAAADQGASLTREQIAEHALRLMTDPAARPRAEAELMRFMRGWLQLNRLGPVVKKDTQFDALRPDMMAETQALVVDTVFNNDGTFANLLQADYTFINSNLAQHYGIGGAGGPELTRVSISPGQRDRGILAHASFLTGHGGSEYSSPTQRGKMVRTRLLCQPLEPPPPGVDPNVKALEGPATTRMRYEAHTKADYCAGCHKFTDAMGYGFEHYDTFGRWRSEEEGFQIDATGTVVEPPSGENFSFDGLTELADYLAANEDVKACMVRYWSYYAFGGTWEQDGCTYETVQEEAAAGDFRLKSVWLALTHAPHFTRRVQGP